MTAVGVGRDDGAAKGELTAILYDSGRLEARRHGSFWLSETPERPGKGWDAAFPRIVTWAELAERATGRRFFAFATHFDHLGAVARRGSARLLQRRGAELAGDAPSVVIGDLNATSEDEPVRLLLEPGSPWRLLDAVSATGAAHHGPLRTFSGFDPRTGFAGGRIDHILVSPAFRVLASAVLTDHDERGYYSDHLPVLAELEIRGPGPATR
jgi:endonuclease/exonuclease/phosphatase family metal-dependent hydrolase